MYNGKRKCEFLKKIRHQVAKQYGLCYESRECHHDGDCQGTCPLCDAELEDLQKQLQERGINEISFNETLNKETDEFIVNQAETCNNSDDVMVLQGDVCASSDPEDDVLGNMNTGSIPPYMNKFSLQFMECSVAGIQFHEANDLWDKLDEGLPVKLEREYENEHDANAIQVIISSAEFDNVEDDEEYILGYIPQKQNKAIATILDMGWKDVFCAEISELKETSKGSKIIKIEIYVQNRKFV